MPLTGYPLKIWFFVRLATDLTAKSLPGHPVAIPNRWNLSAWFIK